MNALFGLRFWFIALCLSVSALVSACAASTGASDAAADSSSLPPADTATNDARTLADGAPCVAVGQPAVGGCEVCCSTRCGGTGTVAVCEP